MEIRLIATAFIVTFLRLTCGEPSSQAGHNKVQNNLHDLFDSINKNEVKRTQDFRNILEREAAVEQHAFDAAKEDFRLARQRNTHKPKDVEQKRAYKRQVPFNERAFGSEETCARTKKVPRPRSLGKRHPHSFTDDDHKLLNFSMILPVNDTTNQIVGDTHKAQAVYLFEKVKGLVESSNATMADVESVQFYLADLTFNYYVNRLLRENFNYPFPGSSLWEVDYTLPMNATIAIKELIIRLPVPTKGYNKNELRGRALARNQSEYVYRLDQIPGRKP